MTTAKLIKLAPTGILLGFLGYSVYSLQPAPADTAQAQKALEKTVMEILAEGHEVTDALKGRIRDPFWVTPPTLDQAARPPKDVAASQAPDSVAEFVRGLSLDATFLQGRDQLAVIDGRIYSRGQSLSVPAGGDEPPGELKILVVTRTGVILRAGGKNYELGYPTELGKKKETDGDAQAGGDPALAQIQGAGQAEMFQNLLNSPLGAMGRSLLGQMGKSPVSTRGAKPGARGNRGVSAPASGR